MATSRRKPREPQAERVARTRRLAAMENRSDTWTRRGRTFAPAIAAQLEEKDLPASPGDPEHRSRDMKGLLRNSNAAARDDELLGQHCRRAARRPEREAEPRQLRARARRC